MMNLLLLWGAQMKKNWMSVPHQGYLLSALLLMMIVGSIVSYSYAEEEKRVKWGFSVLGGTGDATLSKIDMEVVGVIPRVTLPLCKDWKMWDIEFEGNFFYYAIHKMPNVYFLGLSTNTVFKPIQEKWGSIFLLAGRTRLRQRRRETTPWFKPPSFGRSALCRIWPGRFGRAL